MLLFGQQAADSATPANASPPAPVFNRYTIDVAAITRDHVPHSLSEVLVGRVPGLLVTPASGLNGTGARIRFAGLQSLLADEPPLVLLDGMRIDGREDDSQLVGPGPSRLDDIPVEDVETIEVLRGPASTVIYGQGAAAGVILVHSKPGASGRIHAEGFVQGAMRSIPSRWPANYGGVDLDNPNQYMRSGECSLQSEAMGQCVQDYVQHFNPLEQRNPFSTTPQRLLGLSATGGPSWGAFRVAGTFDGEPAAYDIPSVTWSDDFRQWNGRASGAFHPKQNVEFGLSFARTASSLHLPNYGPIVGALLGPSDSAGFSWNQPGYFPSLQSIGRTLVNLNGRVRPASWLFLDATLGFDEVLQREEALISPLVSSTGSRTGGEHTARLTALVPDRTWGALRFTSTLGVERIKVHGDQNRSVINTGSSSYQEGRENLRWVGLYGVEEIALRDRLVLTGTLRHDWFDGGSFEKFAHGGTHPSVALDWIARPEQNGTLGRIALRASYGTAAAPPARVAEVFIISPVPIASAPLEPERTRAFEISADAVGFATRVRAQLSVYDLRSNAIVPTSLSGPSAYVEYYSNGVVIGNRGVVGSITAKVIDRDSWGWDLDLSAWGNRNRMLESTPAPVLFGSTGVAWTGQRSAVHYPTGGYWAFPLTGFSDANGDGIIASNEISVGQALEWMGTPYPTQGAALNTTWRLGKRIRLSTLLEYRGGQTLYNQIADYRCAASICRERNDPATPLTAQANAIAAGFNTPAAAYYGDADYLKLREIALAVDVPDGVAAAVGARHGTVVLGGWNLATWTKYSGGDPEAGSYGVAPPGAPTLVADFGTVPNARTWTLRVRLSY